MAKVGIVTLFTGYNFGSLLQAYASQEVIKAMGYDAHLIWVNPGLIKGRDVRVKKLLVMAIRAIFHPKTGKRVIAEYMSANDQKVTEKSKEKFNQFTDDYLNIKRFTYSELKKIARLPDYKAFICGSDQIWNATALYVDPLYYLRFVPKNKRIAYAPSFGKEEIPVYNRKKIKKYVQDFEYLSIREKKGQTIIKDLIGKTPPVLIDPTLLLDKDYWESLSKPIITEPYILFYFLSEPNHSTIKTLKIIEKHFRKKIIVLPSEARWHNDFGKVGSIPSGPLEFVSLVANADFVCTDSFHGMAFSINLNIPFLVFKREYGKAPDQSSRISSLLSVLGLEERFVTELRLGKNCFKEIKFENANKKLEKERIKAINFLQDAIGNCSYEIKSYKNKYERERQYANY